MLKNEAGKLTIYSSSRCSHDQRLVSIKTATQQIAQQFKLDFEMVKQAESINQIYVYYENGNDEPIPLYCNEGKYDDKQEICAKLRNMMFVLSFHPKHIALKHVRKEILMPA